MLPEIQQKEMETLDAGARFVLKSHGTWLHCGYHLTTSIVAVPLLCLPYAFRFLGWTGGVVCLVTGALVTFYTYNLLSYVLEHFSQKGQRLLRFRDVTLHVLGPKWARFCVGPGQLSLCYCTVIANILLGGICVKTLYKLLYPHGSIKLIVFVVAYGFVVMILAQLPSFHSLRHINMISILLCLIFSAGSAIGAIYVGFKYNIIKDYSLHGDNTERVFGALTGVGIVAAALGNSVIPEIQATIAPPVTGKMFKGLCLAYGVVMATFFSVAISGYWAFGDQSASILYSNFLLDNGKVLVPKWLVMMIIICALVQLLAVTGVYIQPVNELLEQLFSDPNKKEFAPRNAIPRFFARSISVIIATTFAGMLPFFGDLMALLGAVGYMPLDFILPPILFNKTFNPARNGFIFWFNLAIAVVSSALALAIAVASTRQIVLDAKTYKLFANL